MGVLPKAFCALSAIEEKKPGTGMVAITKVKERGILNREERRDELYLVWLRCATLRHRYHYPPLISTTSPHNTR
jgi:hypothetical protein